MFQKVKVVGKESLYLCGMNTKRIGIFASGNGSNAINIIQYFQSNGKVEIAFVLSNNKNAGVLPLAENMGVKTILLSNEDVADGHKLTEICQQEKVDLIVLAGYLRKIPDQLIHEYPERIINIHPALLPSFGGKNMYGDRVHEAVLNAGSPISGITIHFVNEHFDEGRIISQFVCELEPSETVNTVRQKVQELEQVHFPRVIESVIEQL